MARTPRFLRLDEIHRVRSDLERQGFPRLQMFLIVSLTGAAGFMASYFLLQGGLTEMWLRYLAAFGIAYLAFLLLLWLWLRTRAEDYTDIPDLSNLAPSPSGPGSPSGSYCSGNGGDFGGGGAQGSFDAPSVDGTGTADTGFVGDALAGAAEAEELAIPLIAIVLIGALLLSSFFMIYAAPVLFAELVVDGLLSASLYRKLRGLHTRHWLETAIRRTAWPFVATATVVCATGWAMALYAPGAHSVGDVVVYASQRR